jgi:hypothetical protein
MPRNGKTTGSPGYRAGVEAGLYDMNQELLQAEHARTHRQNNDIAAKPIAKLANEPFKASRELLVGVGGLPDAERCRQGEDRNGATVHRGADTVRSDGSFSIQVIDGFSIRHSADPWAGFSPPSSAAITSPTVIVYGDNNSDNILVLSYRISTVDKISFGIMFGITVLTPGRSGFS